MGQHLCLHYPSIRPFALAFAACRLQTAGGQEQWCYMTCRFVSALPTPALLLATELCPTSPLSDEQILQLYPDERRQKKTLRRLPLSDEQNCVQPLRCLMNRYYSYTQSDYLPHHALKNPAPRHVKLREVCSRKRHCLGSSSHFVAGLQSYPELGSCSQ